MSKVKICGIRRPKDIEYVNNFKPDYIGFIFAESKRRISIETAKILGDQLDNEIKKVGVFVNESIENILKTSLQCGLSAVQLHGDESHEYVDHLKNIIKNSVNLDIEVWKAIRVKDLKSIDQMKCIKVDAFVLDTFSECTYGGVGKVFDWKLAIEAQKYGKIFLAGGLNVQNVKEAIQTVKPYGVDTSSGVETEGFKDGQKVKEFILKVREIGGNTMAINKKGRFGEFGGQYVPETLMNALTEVENEYERLKNDPDFVKELEFYMKEYAGRPSLLYYAEKMTKDLGGAKIYLKREDLNHTGSHKINNVLGQVLLAKRMGKKRVIAETGAGQHGVATATAAALFDLECEVFMGKEDMERQALNVFRMKLLGAEVRPVLSGTATLKDACNEAMREWVSRVNDTFYVLGSVMGPHPYPMMVRDFQSIIGKEVKDQIMQKEGRYPDYLIACVGGGSNAMGLFHPFIQDAEVRLIGAEAAGDGVDTDRHAATISKGSIGVLHGMKSYFLQDEEGQINPVYSISAGLDYPGIGPEHAYLYDMGRAQYVPVTDYEAVEAFKYLTKTEGIIPAIESSHAVAYALKLAPQLPKNKTIVINLSGRGDKDVYSIAKYMGEKIAES